MAILHPRIVVHSWFASHVLILRTTKVFFQRSTHYLQHFPGNFHVFLAFAPTSRWTKLLSPQVFLRPSHDIVVSSYVRHSQDRWVFRFRSSHASAEYSEPSFVISGLKVIFSWFWHKSYKYQYPSSKLKEPTISLCTSLGKNQATNGISEDPVPSLFASLRSPFAPIYHFNLKQPIDTADVSRSFYRTE